MLETRFAHDNDEPLFLYAGKDGKRDGIRVVMVALRTDGDVKTSGLIGQASGLGDNPNMNGIKGWGA